MRYLTDSHTMKAVDNCSIHEFGIPSVVLMERAALGVSAFLRKHAEHNNKKTGIKVVCVCGSGNNGADGLAAARQLNEDGIDVHVVFAGTSEGTDEYRLQKSIVGNLGIDCVEYDGNIDFSEYDYIIDAVDTVSAKIELVLKAQEHIIPIISSMGAGNKVDPTQFKITDIYKTKVCPLAKVMRRELKKRHVKKLKVVYSEEKPIRPIDDLSISCRTHCICPPGTKRKCTIRRDIPGSNAFVPSTVGLIIASEVVKDLTTI